MREESKRRCFQTGFTLLEILVAMFILGLIMTTVYTSYTGTLRNINAAEETTNNSQKARVALERIVEDLESAFLPADPHDPVNNEEVPRLSGFIGMDKQINGKDCDDLTFSSGAHVSFDRHTGPARTVITYRMEESGNDDGLIFIRSDTPEFQGRPEGEKGFILCDGLHSINFAYKDMNGESFDRWDSTDKTMNRGRLPAMVSITLEFMGGDGTEDHDRFTTSVAIPTAKGGSNDAS